MQYPNGLQGSAIVDTVAVMERVWGLYGMLDVVAFENSSSSLDCLEALQRNEQHLWCDEGLQRSRVDFVRSAASSARLVSCNAIARKVCGEGGLDVVKQEVVDAVVMTNVDGKL